MKVRDGISNVKVVIIGGAGGVGSSVSKAMRSTTASAIAALAMDGRIYKRHLHNARNAVVMRREIRGAILDEAPGDTTALENPAAVVTIRRTAEWSITTK
jgi:hypothetical protein